MNYLATLRFRLGRVCAYAILGILMALIVTPAVHAVSTVSPSYQQPQSFIAQNSVADYCKKGGAEMMTAEEIRSVIKQAGDAWMAGDADAFASLFLANGEFIVPGNRWVGQAEIRKAAAADRVCLFKCKNRHPMYHSQWQSSCRRVVLGRQRKCHWYSQSSRGCDRC